MRRRPSWGEIRSPNRYVRGAGHIEPNLQMSFEHLRTDTSNERAHACLAVSIKPNENPRLGELLDRHESALRRLGQKQRELKRFKAECEELRLQLAEFLLPIEAKGRSLDDAIHRLFQELLTTRKRSKRTIRKIRKLYEDLQLLGTISSRAEDDEHPLVSGIQDRAEAAGGNPYSDPFFEDAAAEVCKPAPHRGRSDDKKNLRSLFLKLAGALHPDKVQDDQEKRRRTELMKELNRAYQDGDAARILQIELSLNIGALCNIGEGPESESDRRCRVLQTQYELLAEQYDEALGDLREARSGMLGVAVIEVRRNRRAHLANPLSTIIDPMEDSIEFLQNVHDHVEGFAKSEMTLDDFLDGPLLADDDELDDDCNCPACLTRRQEECGCPECVVMEEDAFLVMLDMMGLAAPIAPKRSSSKKSKEARKSQKAARKKNRKKR